MSFCPVTGRGWGARPKFSEATDIRCRSENGKILFRIPACRTLSRFVLGNSRKGHDRKDELFMTECSPRKTNLLTWRNGRSCTCTALGIRRSGAADFSLCRPGPRLAVSGKQRGPFVFRSVAAPSPLRSRDSNTERWRVRITEISPFLLQGRAKIVGSKYRRV